MTLRGAQTGAQGATAGCDPSCSTDLSVSGRAVCEARVPPQEWGRRPPRVPDCTPRHPLAGQREADDLDQDTGRRPWQVRLGVGTADPSVGCPLPLDRSPPHHALWAVGTHGLSHL